ncbi:hypothetical protein [Helicobacter ganmani]|uniref:hypothetical protein n=1 Tax=Helicobacter ganmani TaxID=60246 RepID=UPI003A8A1BB4
MTIKQVASIIESEFDAQIDDPIFQKYFSDELAKFYDLTCWWDNSERSRKPIAATVAAYAMPIKNAILAYHTQDDLTLGNDVVERTTKQSHTTEADPHIDITSTEGADEATAKLATYPQGVVREQNPDANIEPYLTSEQKQSSTTAPIKSEYGNTREAYATDDSERVVHYNALDRIKFYAEHGQAAYEAIEKCAYAFVKSVYARPMPACFGGGL